MTDAQIQAEPEDRLDLQALLVRWTESSRKVTDRYLDLYQKAIGQLAEAHVKTARAVDVPSMTAVAEAQAAVSRDVADAYVTSVRRMLGR